jgi:hypothetical protein
MNKRDATALATALLCFLLIGSGALAHGGAPAIEWWAIAGGGAPASGSDVSLNDTLGQPIVGSSSGSEVSLGAGYWYGTGSPTAVEMASFTAVAQGGAILVTWETASELDLLGFHLYRAEAASGPQMRLNDALIPGQAPGSPVGAVYEFVDGAVAPGVTYWYWLEDVDVRGAATRHGPVSAAVQPGAQLRIYLPLASK